MSNSLVPDQSCSFQIELLCNISHSVNTSCGHRRKMLSVSASFSYKLLIDLCKHMHVYINIIFFLTFNSKNSFKWTILMDSTSMEDIAVR